MTKNIEVYPIGTPVKLGDHDVIITGHLIRGYSHDHLQYECQWFNDGIQTEWVDQLLIKPGNDIKKMKIGFNPKE